LNKVVASFQLLKTLTVNDGSQFPFPTDTFLDFSALQHVWQHTESIHTQNIESYWNRQKTKLKRMKGVLFDEISSYLDEFMWRERWGKTSRASFDNICAHVAQQYPV